MPVHLNSVHLLAYFGGGGSHRPNIGMASNQIKHNVEMGATMTNSFIKRSGTLSKETSVAYENARKEMMASAERMREEMMWLLLNE